LPSSATVPFCQSAGHSLPWANRSCSLTFLVRTGHGMGSLLQYIAHEKRRKRRIGFENACNRTGDDWRREARPFDMLIVRSDELQFDDAVLSKWIVGSPPSEEILRFMSDRRAGKNRDGHPNARRDEIWFRHFITSGSVVAVPNRYLVMAEHVLVIESADSQGQRSGCRRQETPLTIVARSRDHVDAHFY